MKKLYEYRRGPKLQVKSIPENKKDMDMFKETVALKVISHFLNFFYLEMFHLISSNNEGNDCG